MRVIAAFSPGFDKVVAKALARELGAPPLKLSVHDGLARFDSGASFRRIAKAPCLASVWAVFREFEGQPSFAKMIRENVPPRLPKGFQAKDFRLRFMRAGKLTPVEPQLLTQAERAISRATGLKSGRTGADCEFWYVVRSEGGGFFGLLLPDPNERKPEKGELRPSLAAAIAELGGVTDGDVVLDPFAGHGSLAAAAHSLARVKSISVERDRELAGFLKHRFARTDGSRVIEGDARALPLDDRSVSLVLTDPPWGEFRRDLSLDDLYRDALGEMARVLKDDGRAVVLTAREFGLWEIASDCGFNEKSRVDTLVGGKKATAHLLTKRH